AHRVINAKTRGVELRRVSEGGAELSSLVPQLCAVRQGEGLQQRPDCWRGILPGFQRGHDSGQHSRLARLFAFVRSEAECAIFDQRPADKGAEILLSQRRFGKSATLGEPVVGLQALVAKIVEESAMPFIRARAG